MTKRIIEAMLLFTVFSMGAIQGIQTEPSQLPGALFGSLIGFTVSAFVIEYIENGSFKK